MYENKYKNTKTTTPTDLENFLQLLADLDEELEFFALGGTAMVLKGIKEATKDLDFQKLKKRYFQYAETALISDYNYKFKHLEEGYSAL